MTDGDANYFRNRARAERIASRESPNQSARAVHKGLADLYDAKIKDGSSKLHMVTDTK